MEIWFVVDWSWLRFGRLVLVKLLLFFRLYFRIPIRVDVDTLSSDISRSHGNENGNGKCLLALSLKCCANDNWRRREKILSSTWIHLKYVRCWRFTSLRLQDGIFYSFSTLLNIQTTMTTTTTMDEIYECIEVLLATEEISERQWKIF